jgi:acyl carrier protein
MTGALAPVLHISPRTMGTKTAVTESSVLEAQVSKQVAAVVRVKPPYTGTENLYNDLGLESVHALNLLLALEDEFGVHLDDRKFVKCTTIASLVTLIQEAA